MTQHKLEVTLTGDAESLAKAIGATNDGAAAHDEYTAEEKRAATAASARAKATTSGALFAAMESCAKSAGSTVNPSTASLYSGAAKSLAEAWRLLWP